MTKTPQLDTTTAARQARVTVATIRSWCRHGVVAAAKVAGRWAIDTASLKRRIALGTRRVALAVRRPADRLRKGENAPARTGRAARIRTGHHMSVQRRYAVLDALVRRVNTGQVTTAAYLTDVVGADAAFVASYASPYGKAVAKVYREEYGVEPPRTGLARRGRMLLSCFAYSAEQLPVLDKAARVYRRTALLLAA